MSLEKKEDRDISAGTYASKVPVIPPHPIRNAVLSYVEKMDKQEAYKIGVEFFKKGQQKIFGKGDWKYDLEGIFRSKQECWMQNHWNIPYYPQEWDIPDVDSIDKYFEKNKELAISFCTFKYMLDAESVLNHIKDGRVLTDLVAQQKAEKRELPEEIAEAVIDYAKELGYFKPRSILENSHFREISR